MTLPRRSLPLLLLAPLALPGTARAQAAPPQVIEIFHQTLREVLQNAQRLGVRGREQRLRPAMEQVFNLPVMARIAVGPTWPQIPPAQQQALMTAFADWSIANYANRFDGGSVSFVTQGESTLANGDRLVRTQLVRPTGATTQINYLMRDFGGQWRVVDLYLTGTISELASRRSEFTTLLREGGPDRLLAELRQRTATLLRG